MNFQIDVASEHGLNSLGNYIKFQNGIMMCWREIYITPTYKGTWGNLYYYVFENYNFPEKFISKPCVFVANAEGNTFLTGLIESDESCIIKCELMRAVNNASQSKFSIFAIGRWK